MAMKNWNDRSIGLASGGLAGVGMLSLATIGAQSIPFLLMAVGFGAGLALELRARERSDRDDTPYEPF